MRENLSIEKSIKSERKNKMIYKFIDNNGTFVVKNPHNISYLYFPLTNSEGTLLSSISPNLGGDIKQDNEHFLMPPASIEDIKNNPLSRREFFLKLPSHRNKIVRTSSPQETILEAGILYHKMTYFYPEVSITVLTFIPYDLNVEITHITVESRCNIKFIPTFFMPLYGRGENNLRDHRHVTSLLNRIKLDKYGIILKPTMSFNEKSHIVNETIYFIFGYSGGREPPAGQFPTLLDFCGEGGNLFYPESIYKDTPPPRGKTGFDGKEACAALRFKEENLKKGSRKEYIFIAGITKDKNYIKNTFAKLNSIAKINSYFDKTKTYWQNANLKERNQESRISITSNSKNYNGWLKWVLLQPVLRRLFGCSFLPHFDYGKGGRGWRDLWQDALSLLFIDTKGTKKLIANSFKGVRIDGSNATIITKDGHFISDRNSISRVWSDHGMWPYLTLNEYIHKTGDTNILLKEMPYFCDHQFRRAKEIDYKFLNKDNILKTRDGKVYKGSILEHILVENLVQFFNVGKHNITRLENADWNDGLDMAFDLGESVPFSCMYADNLESLSYILDKLSRKKKSIKLLKEITILLDTAEKHINYNHPAEKLKLLNRYFEETGRLVSGEKKEISLSSIAKDLKAKSEWLKEFIRRKEWLKYGFFNGYYDNKGKRVEGKSGRIMHMMLSSQVFAIMSGTASREQISKMWISIKKYLYDKHLEGFRLNTNFKQLYMDLGRAFGFSYGDKENGAFFNHMTVMLSFALYKRGFVNEASEVFNSIYKMAASKKAKIYPMIPEYFNNDGRGMYFYLTGSASWYIYTLIRQVLGIKYNFGDLIIEPKINKKSLPDDISVDMSIKGRNLKINYSIKTDKDITSIRGSINGKKMRPAENKFIIPISEINNLPAGRQNTIDIIIA